MNTVSISRRIKAVEEKTKRQKSFRLIVLRDGDTEAIKMPPYAQGVIVIDKRIERVRVAYENSIGCSHG